MSTPQFTKEQIKFIVALAIAAAYDRLTTLEWDEKAASEQAEYEGGAVDATGMFLASLVAHVSGDGMGIADAVDIARLEDKTTNKNFGAAANNFMMIFKDSEFAPEETETKTITIKGGVATVSTTERSKSIAFFASLNESERLDVLEAARLGLKNEEILEDMDMGDEFSEPLSKKVDEFMS